MAADPSKEAERLSQNKFLKWISGDFQATDLIPVYQHTSCGGSRVAIYCALVPNSKTEVVLDSLTWDMHCGDGVPGTVEYWRNRGTEKVVEYLRYGNNKGLEPLALWRSFSGIRGSYVEISEEFRLFHNLCYDPKAGKHVKIDDAGNETGVIVFEPERVLIRLKEIRQFLAVKEMHLAIYFDNREFSVLTLADLGLDEGGEDRRDGLMVYGLHYGDSRGAMEWSTFSRLFGKRLIPPYAKEKSGFWGFAEAEPDRHLEFIIGLNEHGQEQLNTSDPDELDNYFGANPGNANYLTPVFFRKGVLDKYYQNPPKYSVEDSYLRCAGLWGLQMDNHHDDFVVAWLGDLGRDLPYEEQLHWRSFNVAPCGRVSEVFFRRQILAQFVDTEQPDLRLKDLFPSFCRKCTERLEWPLFLPLLPEDSHYFDSLRIPASGEQKEFDELVQGLAKVLVDSLNEKQLVRLIPAEQRDGLIGSISRLERVLEARKASGHAEHIQFLRDLQDLRSSGSAHRKGSRYPEVAKRFAADVTQLNVVFREMLTRTLNLIDYLGQLLTSGVFDSPPQGP